MLTVIIVLMGRCMYGMITAQHSAVQPPVTATQPVKGRRVCLLLILRLGDCLLLILEVLLLRAESGVLGVEAHR